MKLKSDIKLKTLYLKLIGDNIVDKKDIPTKDEWKMNNKYKVYWKNYREEINRNHLFTKKILINNNFYKYMNYLNKFY